MTVTCIGDSFWNDSPWFSASLLRQSQPLTSSTLQCPPLEFQKVHAWCISTGSSWLLHIWNSLKTHECMHTMMWIISKGDQQVCGTGDWGEKKESLYDLEDVLCHQVGFILWDAKISIIIHLWCGKNCKFMENMCKIQTYPLLSCLLLFHIIIIYYLFHYHD